MKLVPAILISLREEQLLKRRKAINKDSTENAEIFIFKGNFQLYVECNLLLFPTAEHERFNEPAVIVGDFAKGIKECDEI